jgi:DNA-binding protein WhiA
MSHISEVKEELARIWASKRCCRLAELSALLHLEGSLHLGSGGRLVLHTESENAAVARKMFRLLKELFSLSPELRVERAPRLRGHNCYQLVLSGDALPQVLNELGLLDDSLLPVLGVPPGVVRRRCCGISYLRGAFLGGGYVSRPDLPAHLEINTQHREMAQGLVGLMGRYGIRAQLTERRNMSTLYSKSRSVQADFLALVGAHEALLRLQSESVLRELRENVNRRVNSETANLEKAVEAAQRQLRDIRILEESVGLESLPRSLRSVAELRLQHPEASLKELGDLMQPALSKSAVYHRMRRLSRMAAEAERT